MRVRTFLLGAAFSALSISVTQAATPQRSIDEILKTSTTSDWRKVSPDNLLLMDLPLGTVVIELAPQFAPAHVRNVQTLTRDKYWDGLWIIRSHDNYVVQWGDPSEDLPGEPRKSTGSVNNKIPSEYERPLKGLNFNALKDADGWAKRAGFVDGFQAATDNSSAWLTHCYGSIGVGRGNPPDSGDGSSLYVVIGQAPRNLDRNITVIGRVLKGMEYISAMPRGTGPLGFYEKPEQRTPLGTVRLASGDPSAPSYEVLRTDSKAFQEIVEGRRNRRDGWYVRPAGYTNVCNISVPVRAVTK